MIAFGRNFIANSVRIVYGNRSRTFRTLKATSDVLPKVSRSVTPSGSPETARKDNQRGFVTRRCLRRSASRARLRSPEQRAPLGTPDYRVQRLLWRGSQTQPQPSAL